MQESSAAAPQQNEESDDKNTDFVSVAFYNHGLFCATHPRLVIFVTGVIILACSAPLLKLPLFGGAITAEWITLSPSELSLADSKGRTTKMLDDKENTIPRWFVGEPLLYVQQFVMAVHINPWRSGVLANEMIREALKPAFNLSQVISDFTYKSDKEKVSLSDVCLSVTAQTPKKLHDPSWAEYLPTNSCVVLSPANFWNRDYSRFTSDFKILDSVYHSKGRLTFPITLKEFIFGVPLKHTGIYPALKNNVGTDHTIRYAVTVLLKTRDASYLERLKKELEKLYPLNPADASHSHQSDSRDYMVHIYYKGESGTFIEIWHLCLMYFIVFLYLTFSVAKIEMVKSKIGLAFSAVITIMASLTMAAGLCSFFGLVPTLDSSEIFPYLVIVIGVENILVITKSVVSTPFHLDVELRVAQGLSKEGRYIAKNLVIEMAVMAAGYFTYVPAVQEFCLFALVCLSTDFFLQMVFFATVLSIDMRRLELSDLEKITSYQQGLDTTVTSQQAGGPLTSAHPTSGTPVTVTAPVSMASASDKPFTIVTSGSTSQISSSTVVAKQFPPSPPQFLKLLPPLPSASYKKQTSSRCPIPLAARKLPKRLNFAFFVARTRVIQRICIVGAVLYFLYIVSSSVTLLENEETLSREKVQVQNASSFAAKLPIDLKSDSADPKGNFQSKSETERRREHNKDKSPEPPKKEEKRKKVVADEDLERAFDPLQLDGSGWNLMGRINVLAAEKVWRSLSKRHLPQLLGYYNISLVGRYISVLPPVYLGTHLDTTTILSKYVRQQQSSSFSKQLTVEGDAQVEQEQSAGQESSRDKANSEYFLHALYCVVLGVLVMILLFFICKFLNDCQIDPKIKFRRRGWSNREDLLESLPLILDGHMQAVEHLECLGSTIVSVCLGGRIWVWEASSGDCRKVMSRNGTQGLLSLRKRKKIESRARKECDLAAEWDRYSTTPELFSDSESSVHQHTSQEDIKKLNSHHPPLSPRSHAKECQEIFDSSESQKGLSSSSVPVTARSHHLQRSSRQIQAEQVAAAEEQKPFVKEPYRTHSRQHSNGSKEYHNQNNPVRTGRESTASVKCAQHKYWEVKCDFHIHSRQPSDGSQDLAVPMNARYPQCTEGQTHSPQHSDNSQDPLVPANERNPYYNGGSIAEKSNVYTHSRQRSDRSQETITANERNPHHNDGSVAEKNVYTHSRQRLGGSQETVVTAIERNPHHGGSVAGKTKFHTHFRQRSDGSKDIVVALNERNPQNTEWHVAGKGNSRSHWRQGSNGYQDSIYQTDVDYPQNTEDNDMYKCDFSFSKTGDKKDSNVYRDSTAERHFECCPLNIKGNETLKSGSDVTNDFRSHHRQDSGGYQNATVPINSKNISQTKAAHLGLASSGKQEEALRKHNRQGSDGCQDLVLPLEEKHISDENFKEELKPHNQHAFNGYQNNADIKETVTNDGQTLYMTEVKHEEYQNGINGQPDLSVMSCSTYSQNADGSDKTERENFLRRDSTGRVRTGYHPNSNETVVMASSKYNFQRTGGRPTVTENKANAIPRTQSRSSQHESSSNLESRGSFDAAGVYDFKRYIPGGYPRYTSSRASLGSWSSGSDDSDIEWPSCSEASFEEAKSTRSRTSYHGNYMVTPVKPSPVVWCICCYGDFVVTGCSDGSVEFWSISNGNLVCSFTDSREGVTSVCFLSESFRLVVARLDGCLDFLSLSGPTGNCHFAAKDNESSTVNRSSLRNKKRTNNDCSVGVRERAPTSVIDCHLIHRVRAHLKPVSLLRVLAGKVITGSQDRTIKVFRTDECTCVYTLYGHGDGITALFVDKTSPCTVVSGAANGGVRVWDIESGECLSHLRGHLKAVTDVTCTSVHLISVSLDNVMCIWDREHNTCLHRIVQFPGLCSNVIILSKHLFVTGGQGCILLWDINSGRRVRTIPLGNDDSSVFVRRVRLSGNATVVCDYGRELRVLTFPALLNKSE